MIKEIDHLIAANEIALDYFQQQLSKSKEALKYLKKRQFGEDSINTFKLGYAPKDSHYEWHLSNRLIFPFFDIYGEPIGFAGRTLSDETPKYRNSKESPIFQKSRVLFGLFQAQEEQEEISESNLAFLVEGQFDVLRMVQAGFYNTVGLGGSSFTVDQARLLCRYTNKVVVILDSNEAGKKGAKKAVNTLQGIGVEVQNVELPEGEDPDSFLIKSGRENLAPRALLLLGLIAK